MPLLDPLVELELDAVWTDVSNYVRADPGIQILRGRQDEQGRAEPGTLTMALDNRDGRFSPRNPEGAYYGTIGRNTKVRVSVDGDYRFHGEISDWPTTWDPAHANVVAEVTGSGIIRRLGQGAPALMGPVSRYISTASGVIAFWPMDDPQGSVTMRSGIVGAPGMVIEGVSPPRLATSGDILSSLPLPVTNGGAFRGQISPFTGANLWSAFHLYVSEADTDDTIVWRGLGPAAYRYEIRYFSAGTGTLVLRAFNSAGGSLLTSASIGPVHATPSVVEVEFVQNGANIDYAITITALATGVASTTSGSFAATALAITEIMMNSDRAGLGMVIGNVAAFNADPGSLYDEYSGFVGEAAGRRVERLCTEEGITFDSVGDLDASELMGPQRPALLMDLLDECEQVDMGFLYETRDAFGLGYRTRESMYAAAPVATIAYTTLETLTPTEDDQSIRNQVVVTRVGGGTPYSAEVTTGALSTQAPPDGVGVYAENVTLNVEADSQLDTIAEWRATQGTIDRPRYPATVVRISLLGSTDLDEMIALDIGDRIDITSAPIWAPEGTIIARAIGWEETIAPHGWWLSLNLVPGQPFSDALELDDDVNGRLSPTSTTTTEALDATETGVDYTGETWITTASHPTQFPFDIEIGGERMTVTSATGSTFTVTRSVNGVVKAHLTGQAVHLAQPNRLTL